MSECDLDNELNELKKQICDIVGQEELKRLYEIINSLQQDEQNPQIEINYKIIK